MDMWFDSRGGMDAEHVADMTLGMEMGLGGMAGMPEALQAQAAAAAMPAGSDEPTTVKRQRLAAQQADSAFGYTKARFTHLRRCSQLPPNSCPPTRLAPWNARRPVQARAPSRGARRSPPSPQR